nr:MAG TPA: Lysozyme inhibitor LprI [Caudoviricetes sp.]
MNKPKFNPSQTAWVFWRSNNCVKNFVEKL